MRKNLYHVFFSVCLALMFTIYASGISIEQHTCNSCDIITYSVFSGENDSCCENSETSACQIENNAPSCCSPITSNQEDTALNGEKCCTYDSFYLTVSDHYTTGQTRQILTGSPEYISLLPDLLLQQNELSAGDAIPDHINTPCSLPSSSSRGVEFLIFTHQLKIDCSETLLS
ncbi:MAG: hypothetical protein ACLFQS_00305 [Bacteroidales bacterium]